jgi:hypothetical protein
MRAGARPPVVLAPGQVWRAEDGTTRTVILLHPRAPAAVQCLIKGKPMTLSQASLRDWVHRTNAVLADAG